MSTAKKTILIIDDDTDIVAVVRLVLEDEGYTVLVDPTGTYFENSQNPLPDLVLLDLLIEGTNGKKIARYIKSSPVIRHIPVIVISAHTPTEVRSVVQSTGANSFITKPFDIDYLIAKVKKYLR